MWASYWYANVHKSKGFNSIEDKGRLHTYRRISPSLIVGLRQCQPCGARHPALVQRARSLAWHCTVQRALHFARLFSRFSPLVPAIFLLTVSLPSPPPSSSGAASATNHGLLQPLAPDAANIDILVWVGDRLLPREMAKVSVLDLTVQVRTAPPCFVCPQCSTIGLLPLG